MHVGVASASERKRCTHRQLLHAEGLVLRGTA
jgi:hypothetical protein